jgi:CheY-like chemotaxis protein
MRNHRVLIVDDNATNRKLLKVLLQNWGCAYDEAENGTTAIEKLKTAAKNNTRTKLLSLI